MDPLAHTLLGAALARTRLGRDRPLAMPVLVLAANAPDLDVAAYFWSSDAALAFRRGLTHGPLGLALLPALVAWVVWLAGRRRRRPSGATVPPGAPAWSGAPGPEAFAPLLGLAYLAAITHPALDWLNTYGVRFLYPFDRRWFYGDTLFIVDPWVWLVLGAGVVLSQRISGGDRRAIAGWTILTVVAATLLVTAADSAQAKVLWLAGVAVVAAVKIAGRPRTESARRAVATACVGAFALYLAATIGAAVAARSVVRKTIGPVERLMVGPLPATPARREVVAASATEIRYGRFRWLGSPRFEWSGWSRPRLAARGEAQDRPALPAINWRSRSGAAPAGSAGEPGPVLDAALRDPSVAGFLGWARFPFAEIDEHPAYWEVHLMDARYARERDARFGSVTVRVPR